MKLKKSKAGERGNALVEFGFAMILLVPLFLGMVAAGICLGRSVQVTQVCRDSGHMFLDGVDLAQAANQQIVGRLALGMGMTVANSTAIDTAGKGLVVLTQVMMVGPNACTSGGYATTGACPNYNQLVVMKRVNIGNTTLRPSSYGAPSAGLLQADGSITPTNYTTDPSVLVPNGTSMVDLNLPQDKFTYVSEAYFVSPELAGFKSFFGGGGGSALDASYASNFF